MVILTSSFVYFKIVGFRIRKQIKIIENSRLIGIWIRIIETQLMREIKSGCFNHMILSKIDFN